MIVNHIYPQPSKKNIAILSIRIPYIFHDLIKSNKIPTRKKKDQISNVYNIKLESFHPSIHDPSIQP